MPEPKSKYNKPVKAAPPIGKNWFCTCGQSDNQPYCDGKHKNYPGYSPMMFEVTEEKEVWLCTCKKTNKPPYCDGTHKKM